MAVLTESLPIVAFFNRFYIGTFEPLGFLRVAKKKFTQLI